MRPPKPFFTVDHCKQKREEISQFLEKNNAGEISAILSKHSPSNNSKPSIPVNKRY